MVILPQATGYPDLLLLSCQFLESFKLPWSSVFSGLNFIVGPNPGRTHNPYGPSGIPAKIGNSVKWSFSYSVRRKKNIGTNGEKPSWQNSATCCCSTDSSFMEKILFRKETGQGTTDTKISPPYGQLKTPNSWHGLRILRLNSGNMGIFEPSELISSLDSSFLEFQISFPVISN